jgi:hypothetical protein
VVTITLPTLPGLTSGGVHSIPTDWDPAWFRRFITNFLQWADVRNAQGLNGVTISGNVSSGQPTIGLTAPVNIAVGATQIGLQFNVTGGAQPIAIIDSTSTGSTFSFWGNDVPHYVNEGLTGSAWSGAAVVKGGPTSGEFFALAAGGTTPMYFGNSAGSISIGPTGAITVPAPTSGIPLTITANAANYGLRIQATSGASTALFIDSAFCTTGSSLPFFSASNYPGVSANPVTWMRIAINGIGSGYIPVWV